MASLVRSGSNQRLCDGERRTPVGKTDLDHRTRILSQEKVTQDVAISNGHGDAFKVTAGADTRRPVSRQPGTRLLNPAHKVLLASHSPSIALWHSGSLGSAGRREPGGGRDPWPSWHLPAQPPPSRSRQPCPLRARREEESRVVTVTQRQTTKIPAGYGVSRWQRYSAADFPS